ncbi:GNAT family N-acetyltransferase [Hoeflea sp. TYP-13]|uniref:GNAT family N-acetyltransferase n=1 Tax=Hoeflea sp. TYP-13 TaxID=3230023 RepID=UPI0034C6CE78
MLKTAYTSRPATFEDAYHLARLVNHAGEGLAYHHWQTLAEQAQEDVDPWAIGIRRAAGESAGFSHRKSLVAEVYGHVAGCVSSYPIEAPTPQKEYADTPPVFRALLELEDLAVGTHYINVLAIYPEHRGKGLGTMLLSQAEGMAAGRGMSLIVCDANRDAQRLYERLGYRQHATRPMVKQGWDGRGENWVLMLK